MRPRAASSSQLMSNAYRFFTSIPFLILALVILLLFASMQPTIAHAAPECLNDLQGADDEPGQKDLNQFCEEPGAGSFELEATWSFDDREWSGSNTGDSCGLFDTDGNGFADFALCMTVEDGPPAVAKTGTPKLYMCGDDRPDRCTNAVQDTNGFNSACVVNNPAEADDPFENDPLHVGQVCKGSPNCLGIDTLIACSIDVNDVLGVVPSCVSSQCSNASSQFCAANADCIPLTDVCSYPSEQPNSDPSDCIITPTAQDPCKDVDCSELDDDCNTGVCSNGQCSAQPKADGTACGDITNNACNGADTCVAGVCEENLADNGDPCGSSNDSICDNPDTCDGNGNCQTNHEPTTMECRGDAGVCDVPENCDANGNCPADAHEPVGTACGDQTDTVCDDPDSCNANGVCQPNFLSQTSVCRPAAGECDLDELCDGIGGCPMNVFKLLDTPCGSPSDSICDNPDACNGLGACVPNHESNTSVCREDAGECDKAEYCDGDGGCPANEYEPAGTACGDPITSICDNPDTCDASGVCQPRHQSTSTICREDAGECDVVEKCDGNGNCPADAFEPNGTSCGDGSDGVCDDPDTCDGNGECLDNFEPKTLVCRADEGDCDVAEYCDGEGNCPVDAFEPADKACGDTSDTVCDDPDTCDGNGACLDNFEPETAICRLDAGDCDVEDYCDGAGNCPADEFEDEGTPCGDPSSNVCDSADTCDANGSCEPRHEGTKTICRADEGECDEPEYCDGEGACPADGFEAPGMACGDGSDTMCDNPDTCDGEGGCLDNFEPSTTVCREDAGQCDVAERCDGAGNCPIDSLEPNGTSCNDGEPCTGPDTCTDGECDGDPIQPTLTVIKEVVHDNEGHATADDFDLVLDDGSSQTHFRVDLDPSDSAIGSATFQVEHGKTYSVTENLSDALAGYYQPAYEGDCNGTADCADPDSVCMVVNDDIYHKNQASIAFNWLTVGFPSGDDSRMLLEGRFEIVDKSEETDYPDGFFVLLEGYALDWEYRNGGDTTWQPHLWNGPAGGSLEIDGQTFNYLCTYAIVDIDGVTGNPAGYMSGDPVIFDEKIHIDYACSFDKALPADGLLRGFASAQVFTKAGMIFHIRQGFDLVTGSMPTTTTSTTSTTVQPQPLPTLAPATTTTLDSSGVSTTLPGDPGLTTTTVDSGGDDPNGTTTTLDSGGVTTTVPTGGVTTTIPGGGPGVPPGSCWDPNADGKASARDALHMLRAAIGLLHAGQSCPIEICDQNCDGKITVKDALIALKRAIGALQCFTGAACPDGPTCCG